MVDAYRSAERKRRQAAKEALVENVPGFPSSQDDIIKQDVNELSTIDPLIVAKAQDILTCATNNSKPQKRDFSTSQIGEQPQEALLEKENSQILPPLEQMTAEKRKKVAISESDGDAVPMKKVKIHIDPAQNDKTLRERMKIECEELDNGPRQEASVARAAVQTGASQFPPKSSTPEAVVTDTEALSTPQLPASATPTEEVPVEVSLFVPLDPVSVIAPDDPHPRAAAPEVIAVVKADPEQEALSKLLTEDGSPRGKNVPITATTRISAAPRAKRTYKKKPHNKQSTPTSSSSSNNTSPPNTSIPLNSQPTPDHPKSANMNGYTQQGSMYPPLDDDDTNMTGVGAPLRRHEDPPIAATTAYSKLTSKRNVAFTYLI